MLRQAEKRFDFFSEYHHGLYEKLMDLLIAKRAKNNKFSFLRAESLIFKLGDERYDGFAQDIFINRDGDLFVGGERKYLEGHQSNDAFVVPARAECSFSSRHLSVNSDKKFTVLNLNCEQPNAAVLAFLLNHLPKKADEQAFLEVPQGYSLLDFTNDEGLNGYVSLYTTQNLVLRKSKIHLYEWRLAVIDAKPIDAEPGAFSAVYMNPKTFRYKDDAVTSTTNLRVYKSLMQNLQKRNFHDYRYATEHMHEAMMKEQALMAKLPYLKASKMYRTSNALQMTYAHFEKCFPGQTLETYVRKRTYIEDEQAPGGLRRIYRNEIIQMQDQSSVITEPTLMIDSLTINERIQLAIALAKAVLKVNKKGFIHADVKPANLMVAVEAGQYSAKLIDVNLSMFECDVVTNVSSIGSPLYMSPESLEDNMFDIKSDVFSLGIVLAECFGATLDHFKDFYQVMDALESSYQFENLFRGVDDVTPEQKEKIAALLQSMVAPLPENRPSLAAVAAQFAVIASMQAPKEEAKVDVTLENNTDSDQVLFEPLLVEPEKTSVSCRCSLL